jgi:hypothetical protein
MTFRACHSNHKKNLRTSRQCRGSMFGGATTKHETMDRHILTRRCDYFLNTHGRSPHHRFAYRHPVHPKCPSFCIHHSAFCILHSAFIIHHSSLITLHSSHITLHSSLITHHSSLITLHSAFITHHSSLITHHSSLITLHSAFCILHSEYPLSAAMSAGIE